MSSAPEVPSSRLDQPEVWLFCSPPGWPRMPVGWNPPEGWQPDPSWPEPPPDWEFWRQVTPLAARPDRELSLDEAPVAKAPVAKASLDEPSISIAETSVTAGDAMRAGSRVPRSPRTGASGAGAPVPRGQLTTPHLGTRAAEKSPAFGAVPSLMMPAVPSLMTPSVPEEDTRPRSRGAAGLPVEDWPAGSPESPGAFGPGAGPGRRRSRGTSLKLLAGAAVVAALAGGGYLVASVLRSPPTMEEWVAQANRACARRAPEGEPGLLDRQAAVARAMAGAGSTESRKAAASALLAQAGEYRALLDEIRGLPAPATGRATVGGLLVDGNRVSGTVQEVGTLALAVLSGTADGQGRSGQAATDEYNRQSVILTTSAVPEWNEALAGLGVTRCLLQPSAVP